MDVLKHRWRSWLAATTLGILLTISLPATGFSQAVSAAHGPTQTASDILRQGQQYEQAGQWAEALNLYQQAAKHHPDDPSLRQRRTIARMHYDLARRYADASYLKSLTSTNPGQALNIYAEVLLKIESYYVDQPRWVELAGYGLADLEIAVRDPAFRQRHIPRAADQQINQAIQIARRRVESQPIRNRQDAYVVASTVARSLERDLQIPIQASVFEFIAGAVAALDPYSAFMSGAQFSDTMSQIEGNFVGLGVELKTDPEYLEIVNVIPGGPAAAGQLRSGDRILAVDGQAVRDIGPDRAADLLRGTEGSSVSLTLERGSETASQIQLRRRRVEIHSVETAQIVDRDNGVGYIRVSNFQKTTPRDFDAALWKLQREGMRSLIVDLRGNPGGLLTAAVEMADRFISSGVIVSTKGRNPIEDFTHQARAAGTWRVPLVVLVDENSASASEIFAAAIRDHQRGTIVGRTSYGKGSVQGIFPLNVGPGGIRLTTAKFYSPKGLPINQVGVKPDVAVQTTARPTLEETADNAIDNDIRIAVQVASRGAKLGQNSWTGQSRSLGVGR